MPKLPADRYTRPPMARMMQLHQLLTVGKYPNCSTVSRALEISARTIKRDLDFMKYRLGLPIEYHPKRHGYYYSQPVQQFPGITVTEREIFALLIAHKAIAQYHGTPFQRPLESAFRKLTNQLGDAAGYTLNKLDDVLSFRPFAPGDADLQTFEVLTRGLQERRAVCFQYRNLGTAKSQRRHVQPYHLACIDNLWYLFAFDVDRKAMRTFVLTRLRGLELTDERFTLPRKFDPNEYLRGSFSAFKGGDDYEVVIEFDAWATDLMRGRQWHSSQEVIELPGGASRVRLRLNSIEEMERWVLSWGLHAMVVRPKALAERLRKTAEGLASRYSEPGRNDVVGLIVR